MTTVGGRRRPLVKVNNIRGGLEYSYDQQSDERKSSGTKTESETTLMEELLKLQVKGDVYDPKLMSFTALAGFGLSQQEYESDTQSGGDNGDLLNYGFSASFLPTKLYPFSIEAVQTESLIPRAFQSPLRVDDSHEGFNMKLRIPDWPMTFSWSQSELAQRSDVSVTDDVFNRNTDRFSYTLTHDFSDFSRLTFRSDIDRLQQVTGTFDDDIKTQRHRLEHDYIFGDFKQHRLDTRFSFFDREDEFNSQTFEWSENLVLRHSRDFSTFYNMIFTDSTFHETDIQTITGLTGFVHQLYDNLTTQGEVYASKSEFDSTIETTTKGSRIDFDYFRNNPWGVLLAELEFDVTKDRTEGVTGDVAVLDERHKFNDPFPVRLKERNIDPESIVVSVLNKRDAEGNYYGEVFYSEERGDYTVTVVGDETEIRPVTVDGGTNPAIEDGDVLLVDYRYIIVGDLEEDTCRQRFRIEQQFDNGLSVYFSHLLWDRDVDSDIDPDLVGNNTETTIYGIEYKLRRLTLLAEHNETDSDFQLSESDRVAASYYWPLTPKTSLWGSLSHTWLDTTGENTSRDSTLFRAEGKIRTSLGKYMRLSGRIEYRDEDDSEQGPTNGYRIGSSLDYNRASVRLRAGWDTYFLERRNTESDSTRFYLDLTRFF